MMCARMIPLAAMLSMTVSAALGDVLTMTADADKKGHPFADRIGWTDEQPPHDGYGYVVSGSMVMTAGTKDDGYGTDLTFGGDYLQVGTESSDGVFYHHGNVALTIDDFRLVNGLYRCWSAKTSVRTKTIRGTTRIESPATRPFRIMPSHDAGVTAYTVNWDAAFVGEAGTGFKVECNPERPQSVFNLNADNAGFKGTLALAGENLLVTFARPSSLGGALEEPEPEALKVSGGVEFASSTAGLALEATMNRGIAVDGEAKVRAEADLPWTMGWPVSGSGTLVKTGPGMLTLNGRIGAGVTIDVAEGSICSGEGCAFDAGAVLSFSGGRIQIAVDPESQECLTGVLDAREVLVAKPVAVAISCGTKAFPADWYTGKRYAFLKVPAAADLDVDDFMSYDGADYGFPKVEITRTDEGGFKVFYASFRKLVWNDAAPTGSPAWIYYSETKNVWTDRELAHADADYLLYANGARRVSLPAKTTVAQTGDLQDYVFPGSSLTLMGTAASQQAALGIKADEITISELHLYDYSQLMMWGNKPNSPYNNFGCSTGSVHVIKGKIFNHTTLADNKAVEWVTAYARTTVVESVVSGSGTFSLGIYTAGSALSGDYGYHGAFVLKGDNRDYTGAWHVVGSEKKHVAIRFGDESNLGGNPETYDATALQLGQNAILSPVASCTIDDANRGVSIEASQIETLEGVTLAIASNLTVSANAAPVRKTGQGTFALGGKPRLKSAGVHALNICEGAFKPLSATAADGLALSFDAGASLALDVWTDDGLFAEYGLFVKTADGLTVSGPGLSVRLDDNRERKRSFTRAIMTVLPEIAEAVLPKLSVTTDDGPVLSVSEERIVVDDVEYVRISAQRHNGFMLLVR